MNAMYLVAAVYAVLLSLVVFFSVGWEYGRQNGTYKKRKIFVSELLRVDCYLLFVWSDISVSPVPVSMHKDRVPDGYEHHRLNWNLLSPSNTNPTYIWTKGRLERPGRIYRFRPDLQLHGVDYFPKQSGSMLILSIGWLTRKV